jgi:hypothetical protein
MDYMNSSGTFLRQKIPKNHAIGFVKTLTAVRQAGFAVLRQLARKSLTLLR